MPGIEIEDEGGAKFEGSREKTKKHLFKRKDAFVTPTGFKPVTF